MKKMYLKDLLIASLFSILLFSCGKAIALDDFSSDGCSQFPDGTFSQEDLWCDCCITHDIAYWQGGSRQQKKRADYELRACVINKTGNLWLADLMYYKVSHSEVCHNSPRGTAGDMAGLMAEDFNY